LVGLYLASTPVSAQQRCEDLLKYAGERWSSKSDEEKFHSVANWFCSRDFSSSSDARSAAGNASIPIEGFLVGGGFSSNDSQFRTQQHEFCSLSKENRYSRFSQTTVIETINPIVAKAVLACISNQSNGFRVRIEDTSDPLVVKVYMKVKDIANVNLRSFAVTPAGAARCPGAPTVNALLDGSGREFTCERRDSQTAFTLSVQAKQAATQWDTPSTVPVQKKWEPVIEAAPAVRNLTSEGTFSYSAPNNRSDFNPAQGVWSSGQRAPQQASWSVASSRTVTQISLRVEQSPALLETEHVLVVNGEVVKVFKGPTNHRQDLNFVPPSPIKGVRTVTIRTVTSQSDVAWGGIGIFGY